jgi:hypothetical protein
MALDGHGNQQIPEEMDYQGIEKARHDGRHKEVESTVKGVNSIAETEPELLPSRSPAFPQRFEYLDEPGSASVHFASKDHLEQV